MLAANPLICLIIHMQTKQTTSQANQGTQLISETMAQRIEKEVARGRGRGSATRRVWRRWGHIAKSYGVSFTIK